MKIFWPIAIVVLAGAVYAVIAALRQTKQLREQESAFVSKDFLTPQRWEMVRLAMIEEYPILLQWLEMGTIKWKHVSAVEYNWQGFKERKVTVDEQYLDIDAHKCNPDNYKDGVLYLINRQAWVIGEYHYNGEGSYELVIHQYEKGCHLRVGFSYPHRHIAWMERVVEENEVPHLWERMDQKGILRENYTAYLTNNELPIERTFATYHQGQLLGFKPHE